MYPLLFVTIFTLSETDKSMQSNGKTHNLVISHELELKAGITSFVRVLSAFYKPLTKNIGGSKTDNCNDNDADNDNVNDNGNADPIQLRQVLNHKVLLINPLATRGTSYSPSHPLTLSPSPSHPLTLSPSHHLTISPTHPLTHSPTHPLTHSPTYPLTHSPTHVLLQY